MFNGYFFNTTNGEQQLRELICNGETDRTLMIVDPPFGGLVNVLANTFREIWKLGKFTTISNYCFNRSTRVQSINFYSFPQWKVRSKGSNALFGLESSKPDCLIKESPFWRTTISQFHINAVSYLVFRKFDWKACNSFLCYRTSRDYRHIPNFPLFLGISCHRKPPSVQHVGL